MRALFSILFAMLVYQVATAQVSGPSSVNVDEQHTYEFSSQTLYPWGSFSCGNCSVISQSGSGYTYSAVIQFTTPGSATVTFKDNTGTERGTKTVSVIVPIPNTAFTSVKNCGSTTITRSSDPPAGIDWYWQTTSTGTSTANMTANQSITSTSTRYLRARWASTGEWSSSSQSTGSISVASTGLAAPGTSYGTYVISNASVAASVSASNVIGAVSYGWYDASSGGTLLATTVLPTYDVTVPSGTMQSLYVEAFNGCPGTSRKLARIEIYPEPIVASTNAATIRFSESVTLSVDNFSYDSYTWLDGNGNPIPGANSNSYTTSQVGNYAVRVTKSQASPFTTSFITVRTDNYITVSEILVPTSSESVATTLPIGEKTMSTQFFDGVGRPHQTVTRQGASLGDIVQVMSYDDFGRETVKYLPYVALEVNGWAKAGFIEKDRAGYSASPQAQFYQTAATISHDSRPFSESILEASPVSKVLKEYGPGEDWHAEVGEDKFIKFGYFVNKHTTQNSLTDEKVIAWKVSAAGLPERCASMDNYIVDGYYADGQLTIKVTTDEQGNIVREYTDRSGRIVLKKVQATSTISSLNSDTNWALTYYIYDDLGNLVVVLSPEAVKALN